MTGPRTFRQRLLRVFTVLGALVAGFMVLMLMATLVQCATKDRVPRETILELNLQRPLLEGTQDDPFARLAMSGTGSVRDVVEALDRAAGDDRVVAVVAHIGGGGSGMATVEEIRDAVARFRQSGKPAIAFSETFGEGGAGNQGYYVATAFDEIWLQPSGDVGLTGLMSESLFVKGALELLGVQFRGDHRKEYKNALNTFTERRYTEPHKEAVKAILDDAFAQLVAAVADKTGKDGPAVRALIDRGPFLAQEAKDAGLVDHLGYRDEMLAALEERVGEDAKLLYAGPYLKRAGRPNREGTKIALIHGVGPVMRGGSGFDPMFGSPTMGSATVTAALRAAVEDDDVKAIVFRVDSPGGSYVASDTIWRETVRAREAGKPVIVTMGNVAGSGGYFVAMNATKIVAHPSTITGSIGVLTGKPITRNLWNRVGITWDEVHTSRNATMDSYLFDYTAEGWQRVQAALDRIYADFTGKVASGRGLSADAVEEIARGRIWSGVRAKELGLVDELGGFATALDLARAEAGLDADAPVKLVAFPRPRSVVERLLEGGPDSSEDVAEVSSVTTAVERWRPVAEALRSVGIASGVYGELAMPPIHAGP